jgi:P-type Ca2+ transporter type 2C
VVVGDLLVLLPGTIVAADARVLEARDLSVDESALTGESMPVLKRSDTVSRDGSTPIGDRHNLVYKGTNVTGGNGMAVAVGTGRNSEIARIQAMVEGARAPQTLLHRQLQRLGARLAWLSGAACLLVFSLGLLRGYGFVTMLRVAASLAVAAVPEGLPMVSTTTLAIGVRKMRARHVLVRHLAAIETLGAVRSICFDKTGTLTLNRMCVSDLACGGETMRMRDAVLLAEGGNAVDPGSRPDLRRMLEVLVLCNDAEVLTGNADKDEAKANRNSTSGSPTERALVDLACACGIDVEVVRVEFPRLGVVHRTEQRALMITVHATRVGGRLLAV